MADIVERIRERPHDAPMPTERLLDEAAAEIARLRAALAEIVDAPDIDIMRVWAIARAALPPPAQEGRDDG